MLIQLIINTDLYQFYANYYEYANNQLKKRKKSLKQLDFAHIFYFINYR